MSSITLQPSLDLDVDAALDFLTKAFPGGPWSLAAIEPATVEGGRVRIIAGYFEAEPPIRDFLRLHHAASRNLYYSSNRTVSTIKTTPKKGEITHVLGLHVDIDLPKPPHPNSAPTQENLQILYDKITALEPSPTVVIFSGGGFNARWGFPYPLVAHDQDPVTQVTWAERTEASNTELKTVLIGGDHCQNINRWLRLPGTINWPDLQKQQRGRVPTRSFVVEPLTDFSRTWSFANNDPIPHPPFTNVETLDAPDEPLPENAAFTVAELSPRLQKAIKVGDATDWGNDKSKMVWYVVRQLVRRSWPDEAILPFIIDPAYGLSLHVRSQGGDPRAIGLRQINRARERAQVDWETVRDGTRSPRSQANVRRALDEIGARFSFNTFSLRAYVNGYGPLRLIDDDVVGDLRLTIDQRFGFLSEERLFGQVIRHLCRSGDFHPVHRYLNSLVWDGTPRIGYPASTDLPLDLIPLDPDPGTPAWLTTYGGAVDNAYTRMVGRLFLLAAVRRVRDPGCKFDEMLVLVNPQQGTDKSTALQVLVKNLEWFSDRLPFTGTPKQIIEQLAGKWIVEASDLSGMRRTDIEELKMFLSSRVDSDRLAWDKYRTELPRQWVAAGTTNSEVFLTDAQNRRFWPVRVGRFDIPALRRDVDQLWAEAVHYERLGESIRLPEHYWETAAEAQDDARSFEPWVEEIHNALGTINGKVVNTDVWKIVDKPAHQRTQADNRRLGEAMRELGFDRTRARVDGQVKIVYTRGTEHERQHKIIYIERDVVTRILTVSNNKDRIGLDPTLNFDPNIELPQ